MYMSDPSAGTLAWHEVKAHLPEFATRTCDVGTMIGCVSAVWCAVHGREEVKTYSYLSQACANHELVRGRLGRPCTGEDGSSARVRRLQGR